MGYYKTLVLCFALWIVQFSTCQQIAVTLYDQTGYQGASKQLILTRCQNILDFNDRAASVQASGCVDFFEDQCCQAASFRFANDGGEIGVDLPSEFQNAITSLAPCDPTRAPLPDSIEETWLGHGQLMEKAGEAGDIAIYYNDDVIRTALENHKDILNRVWTHVKATYGSNFGPDGSRLSAFIHANVEGPQYGFNSINNYFDTTSNCRNLIDLVSRSPQGWSTNLTGTELDIMVHEVAHIVEGASKGVHSSPSYGFWKDSKWAEIFILDVYTALGLDSERERWIGQMQNSRDNFPKEDTYWFRDWFHPIYTDHGGPELLNNYFTLLSLYYPRKANGWQYDNENINIGEFVHFFSGAAGADLRSYAETAFKWDRADEALFQQARIDFPEIPY